VCQARTFVTRPCEPCDSNVWFTQIKYHWRPVAGASSPPCSVGGPDLDPHPRKHQEAPHRPRAPRCRRSSLWGAWLAPSLLVWTWPAASTAEPADAATLASEAGPATEVGAGDAGALDGPPATPDAGPPAPDLAPLAAPPPLDAHPVAEPLGAEIVEATRPAGEESISDVTVVARRLPAPGTTTFIDAKEIALRGARNVAEALEAEPSVEVNQGPKAGATLQIRGFDEKAVLLMIEGIPVREVYDGHFDIASLPAFSLGGIELERGVTTLLHGPNTAGGILSLRAPTACQETADLSGYLRPESKERLLYGVRLKGCTRLGDFRVFASAGHEHSDGYVLSRDYAPTAKNAQYHEQGGLRDGSDYDRSTVALLVKVAPRRNQSLGLFLNGVRSPRSIPPFEGYGYTRYWRFASYDTLLAGLAGVYGPEVVPTRWGFREVRARVHAHLHRDELRDYEDVTHARLTTNPLAWFVASAYANETLGAVVQGTWALNVGNRLDVALRYQLDRNAQREIPVPRNALPTDWTPWERYAAHTFTVAVEDTQVLGPWRFNAGVGASGMSLLAQEIRDVSYPVTRRIIPALESRLVVDRALGERVRVMAAGGHKVRFPMLKELFSNTIGGNRDLRAERAYMAEAGVDTRGLWLDGLDTSLRLYGNAIRDLIESYRQAYANIGRAVTAGVEVEIRYRPAERAQLSAGYRYLHAWDLEHDRPLDYRTPHRVRLGARASTRSGLTLALEAAYNSGQKAYYIDQVSGGWVEDKLAGYVLTHAHLRYELGVAAGQLYFFADGFNLFDANYAVGSFEPRPGRELIAGLGGRY